VGRAQHPVGATVASAPFVIAFSTIAGTSTASPGPNHDRTTCRAAAAGNRGAWVTIFATPTESVIGATADNKRQPFSRPSIAGKNLTAAFEGGRFGSECGVLLAGPERRLGLIAALSPVRPDSRDHA
jgi:hypothetical protein